MIDNLQGFIAGAFIILAGGAFAFAIYQVSKERDTHDR